MKTIQFKVSNKQYAEMRAVLEMDDESRDEFIANAIESRTQYFNDPCTCGDETNEKYEETLNKFLKKYR